MNWRSIRALRNVLTSHLAEFKEGVHLEPFVEDGFVSRGNDSPPQFQVRREWRDTVEAATMNLAEELQLEVRVRDHGCGDWHIDSDNPEKREESILFKAATRVEVAASTLLREFDGLE